MRAETMQMITAQYQGGVQLFAMFRFWDYYGDKEAEKRIKYALSALLGTVWRLVLIMLLMLAAQCHYSNIPVWYVNIL